MTQADTFSRFNKFILGLRSGLFFTIMSVSILLVAPLMLLAYPLSFKVRYGLANIWVRFNLALLEWICGLSYELQGAANIPPGTGIIFCNHQSAWETIVLQKIFPAQVFILKRELLRLPFFGWALATCEPIAIDRKSQKAALRQLVEQGTQRLKTGRWVVVFPEGTRIAPGEKCSFKGGGALLAQKSGYPVVPVAHNAGEYWARQSFLKYPGIIQIRVGPPIFGDHKRASEIVKEAEEWVNRQLVEFARL